MRILTAGNTPVLISQKIESGNDFNGQAPEAAGALLTPDTSPGRIEYPEGDKGGKFEFSGVQNQVLKVVQVALRLGGQATWTLSIAEDGKSDVVVLQGTTESQYYKAMFSDPIVISPGQYLKLETSGASTAMEAQIWVVGAGSEGGIDGLI